MYAKETVDKPFFQLFTLFFSLNQLRAKTKTLEQF